MPYDGTDGSSACSLVDQFGPGVHSAWPALCRDGYVMASAASSAGTFTDAQYSLSDAIR
jgi:hypothetical protein